MSRDDDQDALYKGKQIYPTSYEIFSLPCLRTAHFDQYLLHFGYVKNDREK